MKKEMTMQMSEHNLLEGFKKVSDNIAKTMENSVQGIASFYSEILEEEVNTRKAVKMLNAQAAFLSALLTSGGPLIVFAACVGWFGISLLKFKVDKK